MFGSNSPAGPAHLSSLIIIYFVSFEEGRTRLDENWYITSSLLNNPSLFIIGEVVLKFHTRKHRKFKIPASFSLFISFGKDVLCKVILAVVAPRTPFRSSLWIILANFV